MLATELFTQEDFQYCVDIRRALHRRPELGFDLPETHALVTSELEKMGLTWTDRYAPCSAVADMNSESSGKTLLLRADMDALPVTEKTGLPYASEIPGRMHACGHDTHTAILLTAARILSRVRDQLPCKVRFLFQPSEECADSGAEQMYRNGVTEGADYGIALHCDNGVPSGTIGVCAGDYMSACDPITITFRGKTAHATLPEQGIDAIQMALKAQEGMKKIVEEEVGDRVYIWSLGCFHGGTAHNVICDSCELKISFRYFDKAFAARVRERCIAFLEKVAADFGGTVEYEWRMSAPPLHNKAFLVDAFKKSIAKLEGVGLMDVPLRKSTEDFAWLLQDMPGLLFRYGSGNEEKGCTTMAHCNDFMPDEDGFRAGVLAFVQFVLDVGELA